MRTSNIFRKVSLTQLAHSARSKIGKVFRPLIGNTKKVTSADRQQKLCLHEDRTTMRAGVSTPSVARTVAAASASAIVKPAVQPRLRPDPALALPRPVLAKPHVKPLSLFAAELVKIERESAGKNEKEVYDQLVSKFRGEYPRQLAPKGS